MFYEHSRSIGDRYLRVGKRSELFSFPLHLHKSFEMIAVEKGEMTVQIGGREYLLTQGEVALIFPGQIHGYCANGSGQCRLCIFSADFLPELEPTHHPVFRPDPRFMDRLYEERGRLFASKALLYEMAATYVKGAPCEAPAEETALICEIAAFIDRRFTEKLTLRQVAEHFGYNYRYMSGLINRHFGESFPKVINQFRISRACFLLRKGEQTITEIAAECGFDSQRNFNRVFKELTGKTPKEMKRQI